MLTAAAAGWVLATRIVNLPTVRIPRIGLSIIGASFAVFVVGAFVAGGLLGVPAAAGAMGILVAVLPVTWSARRRREAEASVRDRWPDVLLFTRSAIAAGSPLEDAFAMALDKTGDPFVDMAELVRTEVAFGGGFASALAQMRSDLGDATADRVLVTMVSASATGGSRVGESVALLSASVADEVRLRKAHDAAMTEQRWTVNVALLAPWTMLALAVATNPQAKIAYSTVEGATVILVGLAATIGGWVLARRTARLARPPRVFS